MVGSQNWQTPGSSTPGPSFGHNLCFRCPNEQCEPILDIYASRAFHWYKERNKPLRFDPSNCSMKFRESTGTPSPNLGVALGVWRLTPSHSPTLLGVSDVTPMLPLGPHPCNPFALVASPKLGLRHGELRQLQVWSDIEVESMVEWLCSVQMVHSCWWIVVDYNVSVTSHNVGGMVNYGDYKLGLILG